MNVLIDFNVKNNRLKKIYFYYKKMKKNTFIKVVTFFIIIVAGISLVFWSAIMILWSNSTETNENTVYVENENIVYVEDETTTWTEIATNEEGLNEVTNIETGSNENTGALEENDTEIE